MPNILDFRIVESRIKIPETNTVIFPRSLKHRDMSKSNLKLYVRTILRSVDRYLAKLNVNKIVRISIHKFYKMYIAILCPNH